MDEIAVGDNVGGSAGTCSKDQNQSLNKIFSNYSASFLTVLWSMYVYAIMHMLRKLRNV
jgi:hypothetical protein